MAYYPIVFMQGDDATEAMDILNERGERGAIAYLAQWETGAEEAYGGPGTPWGTQDTVFRAGEYVLSYYSGLPYVGLCREEA